MPIGYVVLVRHLRRSPDSCIMSVLLSYCHYCACRQAIRVFISWFSLSFHYHMCQPSPSLVLLAWTFQVPTLSIVILLYFCTQSHADGLESPMCLQNGGTLLSLSGEINFIPIYAVCLKFCQLLNHNILGIY